MTGSISKEEVLKGKYDEQFLNYFLNGSNYKQIGEKMKISKYYIGLITKHLYKKFNAINNASLACQATKKNVAAGSIFDETQQ